MVLRHFPGGDEQVGVGVISDNDIQRGVKVVVIAAIVLMVGLVALTLVGAVVGLVWEFVCRVVPIVLFCAVVLAAVGTMR